MSAVKCKANRCGFKVFMGLNPNSIDQAIEAWKSQNPTLMILDVQLSANQGPCSGYSTAWILLTYEVMDDPID